MGAAGAVWSRFQWKTSRCCHAPAFAASSSVVQHNHVDCSSDFVYAGTTCAVVAAGDGGWEGSWLPWDVPACCSLVDGPSAVAIAVGHCSGRVRGESLAAEYLIAS